MYKRQALTLIASDAEISGTAKLTGYTGIGLFNLDSANGVTNNPGATPSTVNISGGTIECALYAISGNCNQSATSVATITGGTLTASEETCIFWPMEGELNISDDAKIIDVYKRQLHGVARGGTATVFPQAIGLAASFDREMLEEIGEAIALEGRAKYNAAVKLDDRDIYKGLTFWAPNVNIFRDPRWGRGHETYGEDPYLSSRLGVSYIRGLQGDGETMKAAACAKHFAVHSGPEALRHEFDAEVSEKDLRETYLPAFQACVQEGHVAVSYTHLQGERNRGRS